MVHMNNTDKNHAGFHSPVEIERKFLINRQEIPFDLSVFPSKELCQGYLCTSPTVRIRKEGDDYVLTYKSKGFLERTEYNLPLDEPSFARLAKKIDGRFVEKTRYFIPISDTLTAELDLFKGDLTGLAYAEVEFSSRETALSFSPPDWFRREVTYDSRYTNSSLALGEKPPAL